MIDGVYHVYVLIRDTRAFLRDASSATESPDDEETLFLRRIYRRILQQTVAVVVVGCVVIPCIAPWTAVWFRGIVAWDAVFRMCIGLMLSIGTSWLYMFAGASLGCLSAPSSFLRSPAGESWMQALGGTRSVAQHRVFCVFGVLVGLGVMTGVALLLIYMAPTPPGR